MLHQIRKINYLCPVEINQIISVIGKLLFYLLLPIARRKVSPIFRVVNPSVTLKEATTWK